MTAATSTTPATSAWVQIDDRAAYRVDADDPNQASLDEAGDAEARAEALHAAMGGRPDVTAEAIELDGAWYVVTTGTGEGIDFAYDPEDIDIDVVSASPVRNADGDTVSGWDYSEWCSGVSPIETLDVAVAYYMEQGRLLGRTGSCMPVLSKEQVAVLKIARDQAERA